MNDVETRLVIVLFIGAFTLSLVGAARVFVQRSRRMALAATASDGEAADTETEETPLAPVRILAFSSEDCRQCHMLQTPVLRWIKEARGDVVEVVDIDAPTSPELTRRYHVLTVPTTVLLDVKGKAHAVNYGFTNAQSLLKQVDEILALDTPQEALP